MTRPRYVAALLAVTASLAACGSGDRPSTATTEATATATAEQAIKEMDGFLLGADEQEVLLRTQQGEVVFDILPEDLEAVGVPHLASHAGLTDIGFKVYYEERDGRLYIKGSEEIPPPF